jgi:TolA-binding protein
MTSRVNSIFVVFCLILLVGLVEANFYFKQYFNDSKDYLILNHNLAKRLEQEKLKTLLVQNQLHDLEQDVAGQIPVEKLKITSAAEYKLKQFGLAKRLPASAEKPELSSVLMEKGKTDYRAEKYDRAIKDFREVLQKYPSSSQIIEAHFLLGESLFQAGRYDECLDTVYEMMNHFPQSEMTGYLMLRNAQILEARRRHGEAAEFYRVIIRSFKSNEALRSQAEKLLKLSEV